MPHLPRILVLALTTAPLVAACGGGGSGDDDIVIDAGDDIDSDLLPTTTITIHAAGNELLAIRDRDGAWTRLTPGANGDATAEVKGRFQLASVCDSPDFFDYYTIFGSPDTDVELSTYCGDSVALLSVPVEPSTLDVYAGYYASFGGEPLSIPAGTYDVVAVDRTTTPPRVSIQHDVAITATTTLAFDPGTFTEMRTATTTVTGGGADTISGSTRISTHLGTWVVLFNLDGEAWLLPSSALGAGDLESVHAYAYGTGPAGRGTTVPVTGDEATVALALPAGIATATASWDAASPHTSWQSADDWENRYFYASNPDYTLYWDAMVTPGWVSAGGDDASIEIADPTDIPGWQPAWGTTRPADAIWSIQLSSFDEDGKSRSAYWDDAFDAALQTPSRARAAERRLMSVVPAPSSRSLASRAIFSIPTSSM